MLRRLLNGVLGSIITMLLICVAGLVFIELTPNISIKAMLRLYCITVIVLDVLTIIWMVFYFRKRYPNDWIELIYPKM